MSIGLGHLELRSGLEHFFGAVLDAPQYMGKDAGELESDRNYSEHKVNTKWRYSNDIVNVWGSLWYCLIIVPLTSLTECHQESLVHDRVPPKKTRVWKGLDQALHFEWSRLLTIIWFMVCCEDIVVHPTYVCQKQWTVDESRSHCFFFPGSGEVFSFNLWKIGDCQRSRPQQSSFSHQAEASWESLNHSAFSPLTCFSFVKLKRFNSAYRTKGGLNKMPMAWY